MTVEARVAWRTWSLFWGFHWLHIAWSPAFGSMAHKRDNAELDSIYLQLAASIPTCKAMVYITLHSVLLSMQAA